MDEEIFIDLLHKIYDFEFDGVFNEINKLENGLAKKSLLVASHSHSENPLELIPTWEAIKINEVNTPLELFYYEIAILEFISSSRSIRAIIPTINLSGKLTELQNKFEINTLDPNTRIVWQVIVGMNEAIINSNFQNALDFLTRSKDLLNDINPKLKDIIEYSIIWIIDYYEIVLNKHEFSETSDNEIYDIARNSNLRFHKLWWKLDYILKVSRIYYKNFTNETKNNSLKNVRTMLKNYYH